MRRDRWTIVSSVERISGERVLGWLRRFILGLGLWLGMDMDMDMGKGKGNGRSRLIFIIGFLGRVIVGGSGGGDESSLYIYFSLCDVHCIYLGASLLKDKSMQ